MSADPDALLDFFRQRMRPSADLDELLALARQLGSPDPDARAQAAAKLTARGPWAVPALRHVMNDLDSPQAAKHARRCLEWVEGPRGAELQVAAARLLALRKTTTGAETLLAFLPFADDKAVGDGIRAALAIVAARPGKVDAALLAALRDPLPLRRVAAVDVLAGSGRSEVLPEIRKLLADTQPQVRLRAALVLVRRLEEPAVPVLIDLLAELPADQRQAAEQALQELAGEWAPTPALPSDDSLSRQLRREVWAGWWQTVDGPTLLAAFRHRTLNKEELTAAKALITQLGDNSFAKRDRATAEVIALGSKVVGLLREAAKDPDLEHAKRVEICLKQIAANEARDRLPLSAPVLLAVRNPPGATEALLGYLPYTEDRSMQGEVVKCVKLLARAGGPAELAVLQALSDPLAARRIVAAEILIDVGGEKHWPAVRQLLTDAEAEVRLRVALALAHAQDRQALPALIELVAELPGGQAWPAEELLLRLAGANVPTLPAGDDPAARKQRGEAWQAWWKTHGAAVDLAQLGNAPTSAAGLTVVAELAANGGAPNPFGGKALPGKAGAGTDRLVAVDRNGQTQWQIEKLHHPIDFQILAGDRVLIAEYTSNRVTERDFKGNVLWEVANLPRPPVSVQRLANGNTFIALYHTPAKGGGSMLEVDRTGKTVATFDNPAAGAAKGNPLIRAAYKMADGQMICLVSNDTCIRLDAKGKEVKRFTLPIFGGSVAAVVQVPTFAGNIDVTPNGHIVVMQSDNTVAEYDLDGKLVWQAQVTGNRATRLANGHTLVASDTGGVVELDLAGKTVWHYQPPAGSQALRARQIGGSYPARQ